MISAGADLSIPDKRGDTPIHYYMQLWGKHHFGHKAMVELLIQNGADLNMKDSFGDTPLEDCPVCQEKYVKPKKLKTSYPVWDSRGYLHNI